MVHTDSVGSSVTDDVERLTSVIHCFDCSSSLIKDELLGLPSIPGLDHKLASN